MNKRILCVLLAALLLLGLLPEFALPTQAVSDMKTSEECIAILKKMEGFVKFPMWDHSQYSVGYGSGCDPEDYPDGITEEEADALLRAYLADMEKALNALANSQNVLFSQNQFDALMLFTYNCGVSWMSGDGEFRQAVLDNTGGNTFLFLISQWCTASGVLNMNLVNRRLIEADMYLNGSYTNEKPVNFTYVIYSNNEGEGRIRVQGYNDTLYAVPQAVPVRTGYRFLGWYTAPSGGVWVRTLTSEHSGKTLYAHWQPDSVTPETVPNNIYQISADQLMSRELYAKPNGMSAGSLEPDDLIVIRGEYADENGIKWGKLANGNWLKLGSTRGDDQEDTQTENGVKVTVIGDYVNVRTGPGTEYPSASGVTQGNQLRITEVVNAKGVLWGKFRGGWICLQYTTYSGGLTPTDRDESQVPETTEPVETVPETIPPTKPEEEPINGIPAAVISRSGLNIRSGAGTGFDIVGSYSSGEKIGILEQKTVRGVAWGRTDLGWVCMQYVRVDEDWTNDTGIYAVVDSTTRLNIRSGPGVGYSPAGKYAPGEKIVILEQTSVSGRKWGRTDKGWVCMDYVRLGEAVEDTKKTEDPPKKPGALGGIVTATRLNIRAAAGTQADVLGSYRKDDRVTILEQKTVSGAAWGRTDKGWICLGYVQLDDSREDADDGRVVLVTASSLRIRKGPGTGNAILGSYNQGQNVIILETVRVGAVLWGRTDKGWICMDYVK